MSVRRLPWVMCTTGRSDASTIRAKLGDGLIARDVAAVQVVEVVETFDLQPVQPAPRREPITEDDVGVLCWMAVPPPSPAVK